MGYEARWNDNKNICYCADTIEGSLSCLLSLTSGTGKCSFMHKFINLINIG